MVLFFSISFTPQTFCQEVAGDSIHDPLKFFIGDWELKDHLWKASEKGNYTETELEGFAFKAELIGPKNTLIWHEDFGNGFLATIMWSYQKETKVLHHLSNNGFNNIGIGIGMIDENNNIKVKVDYPNICEDCFYEYAYFWITPNEIEFKATYYKNNIPNGDFYGGNFVRKLE